LAHTAAVCWMEDLSLSLFPHTRLSQLTYMYFFCYMCHVCPPVFLLPPLHLSSHTHTRKVLRRRPSSGGRSGRSFCLLLSLSLAWGGVLCVEGLLRPSSLPLWFKCSKKHSPPSNAQTAFLFLHSLFGGFSLGVLPVEDPPDSFGVSTIHKLFTKVGGSVWILSPKILFTTTLFYPC
jgi:hypothetical protein